MTSHRSFTPEFKVLSSRRKYWGGRTFRFSFTSFRPGTDFSVRRFSTTEATLLIMMAYMTSKGLGIIRQLIFNVFFGTSPAATAYIAAFKLPDTLFNLIAGGALSSALIPIFISYEQQRGTGEVWHLISLVFNVLLVTLTAFVLLAECLAPQFVNNLLVPGLPSSEKALTTTLTRIMLLHPLILGLGTILTAILNSKRQFLLPALSTAVYDFGLIGGLIFSLAIPHVGIYGPTFGLLVSALCQVGIQIPGLLKPGVQYTFIWNLKHPGLREVMGLLGPNVLAVAIASLTSIIDTTFASYLPDKSSIAAMQNAVLLYGLPSVLLAQAVGQSLLPQITTNAAIVAVHVAALILLLKMLTGQYAILAITLTTTIAGTAEAILLCIMLFLRLRTKVKTDKGFWRLQMRRLQANSSKVRMNNRAPRPQERNTLLCE